MKQSPFIKATRKTDMLTAISAAITAVHLVMNYQQGDLFATTTGAKSVASDVISAGDKAITDDAGVKVLTINPKSNLTKNNSSQQYEIGTATGGTTASLVKTGATFPDYSGKVVHITAGTNIGESAQVDSNTADTFSFPVGSFTGANDVTSEFVVLDDLTIVYVSATEVEFAVEETTDKAIDAGSADQVNISAGVLKLPLSTVAA